MINKGVIRSMVHELKTAREHSVGSMVHPFDFNRLLMCVEWLVDQVPETDPLLPHKIYGPSIQRFKQLASPGITGICWDCKKAINIGDLAVDIEEKAFNVSWLVYECSLGVGQPEQCYCVCNDCADRIEWDPNPNRQPTDEIKQQIAERRKPVPSEREEQKAATVADGLVEYFDASRPDGHIHPCSNKEDCKKTTGESLARVIKALDNCLDLIGNELHIETRRLKGIREMSIESGVFRQIENLVRPQASEKKRVLEAVEKLKYENDIMYELIQHLEKACEPMPGKTAADQVHKIAHLLAIRKMR